MTIGFTGHDLVEVAVQMERSGNTFYSQVAEYLADAGARQVLQRLARDEVQHLEVFTKILGAVGVSNIRETYPGEYQVYLKAHVDSQTFNQERMERLLAQKTSLSRADALQFGVDAEKDAILYYTEMKRFISASEHAIVDRIIDEERGHLAQLVALLGQGG